MSLSCCCYQGCEVSEEEAEEERRACEHFQQVQLKRERLPEERSKKDLEEELACIKELIRVCGQIPTISLKNILSMLVEDGFEISTQLCEDKDVRKQFEKDLKLFSTAGLQLSTLLHGRSHSRTLQWKERLKTYMKGQH